MNVVAEMLEEYSAAIQPLLLGVVTDATGGTGLDVAISAWNGEIEGIQVVYPGALAVTLVDNIANYLELGSDGILYTNTVGYTIDRKRLATVTTGGGVITDILDTRQFGCTTGPIVTSITDGGVGALDFSPTSGDVVAGVRVDGATIGINVLNELEVQAFSGLKGDLLAGDGAFMQNLAVGTNGYFLTADSGAPLGVSWVAVAPGSGQANIQFEDEGVPLGAAGDVDQLDFTGVGVTATRLGNKVTVDVSGGGSGSGERLEFDINQVAHGFTQDQWLYNNGGVWTLADATLPVTADVVGVVSAVAGPDDFTIITSGKYVRAGLAGADGDTMFLATVAGDITATPPATPGEVVKPIGVRTSDGIVVMNMRGNELTSGGGGSSTGEALVTIIPQLAHGFSTGDWVYNNAGTYTLADASVVGTADAIGVVNTIVGPDDFELYMQGKIVLAGLPGVDGDVLYLSTISGDLTLTPPATPGEVVKPLGVRTTDGMLIFNWRGNIVGGGGGGGGTIGHIAQIKEARSDLTNPIGTAIVGNSEVITLADAVTSTYYFDIQIPQHTDIAKDLEFRIGFDMDSSDAAKAVELEMEYTVIDDSGSTVGAGTTLTETVPTPDLINQLSVANLGTIKIPSAEVVVGSTLTCKVSRLGADVNDTHTGTMEIFNLTIYQT
jgi:hypothetical protein